MPSYQNSAGPNKSAKFINQNPLDPLANPFSHVDDNQNERNEQLSENVNKRLTKAMEELVVKHSKADAAAAASKKTRQNKNHISIHQQQQQQQNFIQPKTDAESDSETEDGDSCSDDDDDFF